MIEGKTAKNVVGILGVLLSEVPKDRKVKSIELTAYDQLGEYAGELILPRFKIEYEDKNAS